MDEYVLPRDTLSAFQAGRTACRNPGLLFERYVPKIEADEQKKAMLQRVIDCRPDQALIQAHLARWQALAKHTGATTFQATTEWRFVTGLGRKGALEVGFHFHPLYGFPIIPGSGLKGVARAWALLGEGKSEDDPEFVAVFGRAPKEGEPESAGRAGGAIFFDAVPGGPIQLSLDVINPHYPDYYRPANRQPPANWQSPVPVCFLAVPAGTRFHFAVGWRGSAHPHAHSLAVHWLKAGLRDVGVGAKTSAGYGYWQVA